MLSKTVCEQIDQWVKKYPAEQKQSAVIPALLITQEANGGWLSEALVMAVADYLQMPHIAAFEVATFYSMFELTPVGKHKISVCTNISCMLAGCEKIVDHLEQKLQVKMGQTTRDQKVTLRAVECLGSCGTAPMFQIGHQYYENLTPAKVDEILAQLD